MPYIARNRFQNSQKNCTSKHVIQNSLADAVRRVRLLSREAEAYSGTESEIIWRQGNFAYILACDGYRFEDLVLLILTTSAARRYLAKSPRHDSVQIHVLISTSEYLFFLVVVSMWTRLL